MSKIFLSKKILILLLSVIILSIHLVHSFNLRSIGYDRIPEPYVVMDERTYIWQSLSIRKSGIPIGWVAELQSYTKRIGGNLNGFNITVDGKFPNFTTYRDFPKPAVAVVEMDYGKGLRHTQIVQPFLEKPPLGSLILGALVPNSIQRVEDLSPNDFRKMSLYLATLTEILIFLLGWQIVRNPFFGLLAAVLYGSIPTFILLSHYALLENVLTPLLLLMLNLLIWVNQHSAERLSNLGIFLAGVAAGFTALTKQAGWPIIFAGIFILWFWKFPFRRILLFSVPAFLIGSLYFIWGLYLAPTLFVSLYLAEGVQKGFVGSLNLLANMMKINILNFPFDGFWLGGFISIFFIPKEKRLIPIFASIIAVLFGALILAGFNNSWYLIPLIPFMSIAIAYLVWRVITQPTLFEIMLFFLTFFSSSFFWGYIVFKNPPNIPHYQYQPFNLYRLLFLFFLIFGLAWEIFPKLKRFKIFWIILMGGITYQLIIWNDRALLYMISHWGRLPLIFTLGVE